MAAREAKLIAGMLPMSESNDWADAKSEWEFSHTTRDDRDTNHCLCGQAIKNLCYLTNRKNAACVLVGCVCVQKFVNEDLGTFCLNVCKYVDNVRVNESYRARDVVLKYCYENRAITQWELNFLNSIQNKQLGKLTANQIVCLTKLNKKMILYITTKK
jgi:hypothetical protein